MGAILEAILTQILEVIFMGVGFYTGAKLIPLVSLGRLHIDYRTSEALETSGGEKAKGLAITYVDEGKRYVVDWFVMLAGVFFWVGLVAAISMLISS